MFKRIKEYFELRKLYNDSKKVLVINAASTITSIKNIVEKIESYIDTQGETISSISKEDLNNMVKFMTEMTNNKYMHSATIKEIVKSLKEE